MPWAPGNVISVRQRAFDNLQQFFSEGRLNAEIKVLVENLQKELLSTTIRRFSLEADLVFLGMRPPMPDESPQEYALYYENLMKNTEKFPLLAFVLSSEDIKFSDIFR